MLLGEGRVEIENPRYRPEAFMAITKNVPKIEKVIRIVGLVHLTNQENDFEESVMQGLSKF